MTGANPVFFFDEPARIYEQAAAVELEFQESMEQRARKGYVLPGQMKLLNSAETVTACISRMPLCCVAAIDWKRPAAFSRVFSGREEKFEISSRSISSYNNSFEALVKDLKRYKKTGSRVLLLSGSRTRARRLAQDLRDEELVAVYSEDPYREVQPGEVLICYGHVDGQICRDHRVRYFWR